MNEDDATRMLANLGERVPVGPAPIDVTLQQGKGNSRRRRAIQVVSGAAAVAVIAVGAFIVGPSIGGSGNLATQPTTSPRGLAVPAGTRLVGINGVAVAVPEDWSTNDTLCGFALSDTVDFNDTTATRACAVAGTENFSRLLAVPLSSEWGQAWPDPLNGQAVDLQGLVAQRVPAKCNDSESHTGVTCSGRLIIASANAVMSVNSPNREVVDAVLDSATLIPEGYTAVPDLTGLHDDSEVEPLVESAGLLWENRCPDGYDCDMGPIAATDPAAGSVVLLGTTVRAVYEPGRIPDPPNGDQTPASPVGHVPTEQHLLGLWRDVGLARQLENAGFPDQSSILEFSQRGGKFWWGGTDDCNSVGGRFKVDAGGAFSTFQVDTTLVRCPSRIAIVTVPEVMEQATQARLIKGQLRVFDEEDSLLGTFERLEATSTPTTPPTTPPRKSNQNEPREGTPIPLSTSSWKPGDDAMQAGIAGRIQLSKDGCVYLEGLGGVKNDVIWPAGYSADVSADGVLTVRNPAGEPVGHEGTKIYVAGGGASEDEGGISDGLLRLLVCQVSDTVVYINDELPPL